MATTPNRSTAKSPPNASANELLFATLADARTQIAGWKEDYNRNRPHSALGNVPPAEFAMKIRLEKQAG